MKKRYLLVMPRLIENPGDGYSFPLGITYISASMKNAGFDVYTINLNSIPGDVEKLLWNIIDEHQIDVVATGGLSFQYNTIRKILDVVKKKNSEIITVIGGGIITGDPLAAMAALEKADFGVIGEGEVTMNELCSSLEAGCDISAVQGIVYKDNENIEMTEARKEAVDINKIPWPDYEGFDLNGYLSSTSPGISGLNETNTIFMLASRSCPFKCTFCFHTTGNKYRQRDLDDFFNELDCLVSKYDIRFISLSDELFARDINRVKYFCKRIKKYDIGWWAQFRVDDITPELITVLKNGQCKVMSFGLESADNRILKSMQKHTRVDQIEYALDLVYKSGIPFTGAFIFGDIAETYETASNTLKWWRAHTEYNIVLNLITVYPGSYLYRYALKNGIIKDPVKFLKKGCPQINVSQLNDSELGKIIRNVVEAPMALTKKPASLNLISANYRYGRISVKGCCMNCHSMNKWSDIKILSANFIECKVCKQKYNVPLPVELRNSIDDNFNRLIGEWNKIAVWGVNYHTCDLFKRSDVLKSDSIYPVDISQNKQKMDLYGKKIFEPKVINANNIKAVVVAIPVYFSQIIIQIKSGFPGVEKIIDICELTDPQYHIPDEICSNPKKM